MKSVHIDYMQRKINLAVGHDYLVRVVHAVRGNSAPGQGHKKFSFFSAISKVDASSPHLISSSLFSENPLLALLAAKYGPIFSGTLLLGYFRSMHDNYPRVASSIPSSLVTGELRTLGRSNGERTRPDWYIFVTIDELIARPLPLHSAVSYFYLHHTREFQEALQYLGALVAPMEHLCLKDESYSFVAAKLVNVLRHPHWHLTLCLGDLWLLYKTVRSALDPARVDVKPKTVSELLAVAGMLELAEERPRKRRRVDTYYLE